MRGIFRCKQVSLILQIREFSNETHDSIGNWE